MIRKNRRTWATVGLFLLALVVRTFRGCQEVIANPDVMRFVDQMHNLARDPTGTLRSEVYHPLQAALGLLVHSVVGGMFADDRMGWVWSLRIVGILAGSLLAVQIARLARWFGAPFWASWATGVVWIVGRRSSVYGSDGLSDMVTWSLFAASLLLVMPALRALQRREGLRGTAWRWLAGGAASGLAYLARPEGSVAVVLLLGTLGVLSLRRLWRRKRASGGGRRFKILPRRPVGVGRALAAGLLLLTGYLIVALPYMVSIGGFTGKKALVLSGTTPKESAALAAVAAPGGPGAAKMGNVQRVTTELAETFSWGPWLAVMLAVPLKLRFWGRPRLRATAFIWILLWDGVMYWLIGRAGYLDGRHTLPMIILLHLLLALALPAWAGGMARWMAWWRQDPARWATLPAWRRWRGWPRTFGLGVFAVTIVPSLILLGERPRGDKQDLAEAVQWIKGHVRQDVVVCDFERLVGYYSGHPYGRWSGCQVRVGRDSHGDPTWMQQVERMRLSQGMPAILGKVYLPAEEPVLTEIGAYREVARFVSNTATNHDVYVLYARPDDAWQK